MLLPVYMSQTHKAKFSIGIVQEGRIQILTIAHKVTLAMSQPVCVLSVLDMTHTNRPAVGWNS
jgi:hypothetical protein